MMIKNLLLLSSIRQGKNTIITVDIDDRSFLTELIKNVNYLLSKKLENKPAFLCKSRWYLTNYNIQNKAPLF